MVRSPDIDNEVETACDELVEVVGDVARVVGWPAVRANDHVVFVLAEFAGSKPDGPFAFDQLAVLAEEGHGAIEAALRVVEGLFAEPLVVVDAERFEGRPNVADHDVDPERAQFGGAGLASGAQKLVASLVSDLPRQVDHVIAGVAILGDIDFSAKQLLVACVERVRERVRLGAGVVDVVFAFDAIAGSAQG